MATTPEVLQRYLTANINCQVTAGAYKGGTATLYGLNLGMAFPVRLYDGVGMPTPAISLRLEDILPVLRPFSQLCEPVEGGVVPAVEALRLALGWPESFNRDRFAARLLTSSPGEYCVRVESYSDYSGGWIRLGGDFGAWLFDSFDSPQHSKVVNPCAAYDYLRSQHFAVGLEPHEFIEKAAAPTPTTQEGASHE